MEIFKEAYTKELDRLLWRSEVPVPRPENEYYAMRKKDGRLIAAGVCWTSRLHPKRIRFFISVEELYRGRGYGTEMFRRMQADHEGAKWQGSADLDNEDAEWWLRGMGFEFSYRSYWLDGMVADLLDHEEYGMELRRMDGLTEEQKARLISMAWTDYTGRHEKIDPLNEEMDAECFVRSVLGELNGRTSWCLMNGEEIDAYLLCGAGADDWTASARQTGHRLSDPETYRRFLLTAVNRVFEQAGGLIMEAESFDADALTLLRLFGDLPDDSYDTYVLE